MPYNIHLAENETEALEADAHLSIDYQDHKCIFDPTAVELYDLTLFYNLSDFYQNAVFLDDNVVSLRGEVEEARRRIENPRATHILSEMSMLCERARKSRLNIFAFGE
tara:strand:+ start:2516 stop:2839 length:324 start_codon:yes stop_codon:yes gene_type:complete